MDDTDRQYLTFSVGADTFGLKLALIREVLEYREPTPVPTLPRALRGVINLRGTVIPVVDLAVRVGLGESRITRTSCILTVDAEVEGEPTMLGLLVDAICQVVDGLTLEPTPQFGSPVSPELLVGVGTHATGLIHVLDLARVLAIRTPASQPTGPQAAPSEV